VLDPVLRDTGGIWTKGFDDYRLSDLVTATISGANGPKAPNVLGKLTAVLNKAYDFKKKIAVNFESQQAAAAKVGSYGITIGINMMVLTLMANMDLAEQYKWGREFHTAMQSIHKWWCIVARYFAGTIGGRQRACATRGTGTGECECSGQTDDIVAATLVPNNRVHTKTHVHTLRERCVNAEHGWMRIFTISEPRSMRERGFLKFEMHS
jgi:hypothetical protein